MIHKPNKLNGSKVHKIINRKL